MRWKGQNATFEGGALGTASEDLWAAARLERNRTWAALVS